MLTTHRLCRCNPSWLKDECSHRGGSWAISNMDSEPGQPKWLAKENLEEMPHKRDATGVQLSLSESVHVLCPHVLYSFSLLKILSLLSLYFVGILLQSQRARALSLPTGLVARVWCAHHGDPTSISGCELKPHFKLQAETTWDQEYIHRHLLLCGLFAISLPKSNHLCVNQKASVLNLAKLRNRPRFWLSQQDIASLLSYILDRHSNLNTREYFNPGRD